MTGPALVRIKRRETRQGRRYRFEESDGETSRVVDRDSVTWLIKSLDKPALPYWAAGCVADEAIRAARQKRLEDAVERGGEDEADVAAWLRDSPWRLSRRGAKVGTSVHRIVDARIRGAEEPQMTPAERELALPYVAQWEAFNREYRPTYEGAEMAVWHEGDGWAGTLDQLATIGSGGRGLIDLKTTNPGRNGQAGVYLEAALQVGGAYAHGEYIVGERDVWVTPTPMPEIRWAAVLWLNPERYALVRVDSSEATYRAFLVAAEAQRWLTGPGKDAIRDEIASSELGVMPELGEAAA